MPRYNPATVEPKWQAYWEEHQTFASPQMPTGEKLYALDMFPYPSGDGLHVGHPEGYTATDIVCRAARMQGKSVLHPMGFDAFGLPAEEHAIKTGEHPRIQTEKNIDTFRRQLKMLGFSYDWSRELATTDVEYFRWTQWIFLQIYDTWFDEQQQKGRPISELPIPDEVADAGADAVREYRDEHRLAFQSFAPVNWCPALGTVLANEEVIDGKSERGGHPVERRPLRQWMLRITAYASRLESDLEFVDWPESVKALQRNWIGQSIGAEVDFYLGSEEDWSLRRPVHKFPRKPGDDVLRIYTTRPDTLFGATYIVIAPEHPFVERLTTAENAAAVKKYCGQAAAKSDLHRAELAKEKTGVFTGSFAINPANGERIPIWIADYVLISYGTGAIMAVPAHDERDFEFAKQYEIAIKCVVKPGEKVSHGELQRILAGVQVYAAHGTAINSGEFDGLPTAEFKRKITESLAARGLAREAVNYKLRDWLFSRQRFWGEPFPVLHELDDAGNPTGRVRAVDEADLPVDLPHLEDFKPHGRPEPPLDKAPDEWLYPVIDGIRYKRETNTMPQWAGSCWYYLRFLDTNNSKAAIDPTIEKAWMPIDLYVGGAEHAVLHLLYARFWHKVLYDRGVVSTPEPFQKLINQGMILGENNEKMSKSRGNVVNPDSVVKEYGADSLRLYEMFMGPLEATKPWSMEGVNGMFGFLGRVWRMIIDDRSESIALNLAVCDDEPTEEAQRVFHKTVKAVTEDIAKLSFNTAIARMMEFTNYFTKLDRRPRAVLEPFVLLLAPFAPHIAEELWRALGHEKTLAYEAWPIYDDDVLAESTVEIPVQINGKLRGKITVPADADAEEMEKIARNDAQIAPLLEGKQVTKKIVVPGRMVSFVVKD
ncbi:leucine--tRNA ligase [Bythopirellula polymerisocia]|uniref:Leucine--tRNA ligase n=1 Tax=Bythopirellula polymerisocia TaxID=2528003 RepID=A0A5C6CY89_9BACT|nr:leucine--tRNA ligase [Bythopirellula polymerisocia]TWU28544.1 Leucine--tRNA ligase [Bythopirellula polymerisocia]